MTDIWTNKKPINKTTYNIGNKIVDNTNPVWDINGQTGVPITARHDPCGYWYGKEPPRTQAERITYGQLFVAGNNGAYQLGLGTQSQYQLLFTQSGGNSFFTKAITNGNGAQFSFAFKNDGTLWCVGANTWGQLGLGDNDSRTVWTQVPGEWMDIAISPYYGFSVGIKKDGTLWVTGYNNYGQLGLGDQVDRNIWTQVGISTKWRKVACGSFYTMAINDDGNLFTTGSDYGGNLGLGQLNWPFRVLEFTYVSTVSNVDRVDCGYYHTVLQKTDGSLYGCGYNSYGQLGLGDTVERNVFTLLPDAGNDIIDFCMGLNSSQAAGGVLFIIKGDHTLWAAGTNANNIMGIPDTANRLNFVQLPGTNWDKVHSKDCSVLLLDTDGKMFGCGKNDYGELGLGDTNPRTTFTQIGTDLWLSVYTDGGSMAIRWDGTYVWR